MTYPYKFVWLFLGVLSLTGCGGSSETDNEKKSMVQYDLAVGLHQEGNLPAAFQAATRAIELDANNAKAHLFMGILYLLHRTGNEAEYDREAEHHFREVTRIQSSENAFKENLAAEAHDNLGVLFTHQKRYKEAEKELLLAISDIYNRKAFLAWGNLGWVYLEMGQLIKARDALLRAVELQPRFCVGYYRLGQVYSATREYEKADKAFTSAIEADERCKIFQQAWYMRGKVRAQLGDREQAIADLERCAELESNSETGQSCRRLLDTTH